MSRIRVHRVKQFGDGSLEVLIRGGSADATYVSGRLKWEKGVHVSDAKEQEGMSGFVYLVVRGTDGTTPFTRERAIQLLSGDENIEVVPE